MIEITEYIEFGQFNSKDEGFYLIDRSADTPSEKTVTENLNYSNGVLDFSNITGERFYNQRTITYKFSIFNVDYDTRKAIENKCKRLLMQPVDTRLYDSHDRGYYWIGKAQSVKADDDASGRTLSLTVEFSLYPFAIKNNTDVDTFDDWDNFDLINDFMQPFSYSVQNTMDIDLMNIGENSLSPSVVTNGPITIIKNGQSYSFDTTKSKDYLFSLEPGNNHITVQGTANVRFIIQSEVLL